MTDWADGIETRNYGIKSELNATALSELIRTIIPLAMIAGSLLFYSWVRSQIVNTGYVSQSLFDKEQSLLRDQRKLVLEEEMLSNPGRIDLIARTELGMTPLRPNQIILGSYQDLDRSLSNTMAMADSGSSGLKTKMAAAKPSGFLPAN